MVRWSTENGDDISLQLISVDARDDPDYSLEIDQITIVKSGSELSLDPKEGETELQEAWKNNRQIRVEVTPQNGEVRVIDGILTSGHKTLQIMREY